MIENSIILIFLYFFRSNVDKSTIYMAAHYSEKMKLGLPKRKSMQFPKMPDPFTKLNQNT